MKKGLLAILVLGSVVALESPRAADMTCQEFTACIPSKIVQGSYHASFQKCMGKDRILSNEAQNCAAFIAGCKHLRHNYYNSKDSIYSQDFPSCLVVDPEN